MENLLGKVIYKEIIKITPFTSVLEIRVRKNQPVMVVTYEGNHFLKIIANKNIIDTIVSQATKNSLYAYENEITKGYINYRNGIRIGLTGDCNITDNNKISFREFYALCIRIPHQIFKIDKKLDFLLENFESTLIISPPFGGKTTLIREMARLLSNRYDTLVIDERGEICGSGVDMKVGMQCDVISNIPKNKVYGNIIRAMNPQLIVCDELFGNEDIEAVSRIANSGIMLLATYHAEKFEDVPISLCRQFVWCITLNSKPKVGSIKSIIRRNDV